MAGARLIGEILRRDCVSPPLAAELFELFAAHYEGGSRSRFYADLSEKDWVLVLRERLSGKPVGFSTQVLMEVRVDGAPVRALFSGDTVIHRDYWGSQELTHTWFQFAGEQLALCGEMAFYWFLISKGHRTYLYLPLFFRTFYPRFDMPTPGFEQRLINTLGTSRFPNDFQAATGLVEWQGEHDRLKAELDQAQGRQSNPHVRYFLERNPRYHEGTDLACVARICPENLRRWGRGELETAFAASRGGA